MLRTKQLGSISQSARSFFLATSRVNPADGASCSYSDDETCPSRKSSTKNNLFPKEKKSTLFYGSSARGEPSGFKDVIKVASHYSSDSRIQAPITNVLSPRSSEEIAKNVDVAQNLSPSKFVAEHMVKAGIASVRNVIQDLVNGHEASDEDGLTSHIKTVDSGSSVPNLKSSNRKSQVTNKKNQVGSSTSVRNVIQDLVNGHQASDEDGLTSHTKTVDSGSSVPNLKSSNRKSQVTNKKNQVGSSTSVQKGSKNPNRHSKSCSDGNGKSSDHKVKQTLPNATSDSSLGSENGQGRKSSMSHSKEGEHESFIPGLSGGTTSDKNAEKSFLMGGSYIEKSQQPVNSARRRATAQSRSSAKAAKPVDAFLTTLRELKWGSLAEETLRNLHYKLDAFQANQVLKVLQDHTVALGFFNWLKHQPGFRHDEHTYTTMVGILGRARQFSSINRLLEEMVRDGCHPNVVTYNRLIHGYGRANHIEEAMEVFDRMQYEGCQPDHVTFCTLIDIHAKAGYLDVAMDLYQKMLEAGLCPDTFTYSVMINCLGKAGHLPDAYKLFCEMIEMGCVPNLVTYNIMIALQAKSRNYTSALNLYRNMRNAGFFPDKITYSIVMEVLGHCGHLDEVEAVFVEMQQVCPPDEPVYGLLVDLWGKAGKVDKARSWYHAMLDAGLKPNVPTCNSLLSAFLRVDRYTDAYYVLQNMLDMGLTPSLQTYTLLLSCCTETENDMGLCRELLAVTGHPAHVFLSTLPYAEPGGQNVRNHTSAFLDLIHSEDRESKRGLVDAVIDFLQKSGLKAEAGSVWEVAAERNVYPDVVTRNNSTYWLINLHVMSDGTAVIALSRTLAWFRRRILESGHSPKRIDIITGWGRRSRVTGSSLVRKAVSDLLHLFQSPFYTESRNSGCFVGSGGPLHSWLLHSYVDRMHLL